MLLVHFLDSLLFLLLREGNLAVKVAASCYCRCLGYCGESVPLYLDLTKTSLKLTRMVLKKGEMQSSKKYVLSSPFVRISHQYKSSAPIKYITLNLNLQFPVSHQR